MIINNVLTRFIARRFDGWVACITKRRPDAAIGPKGEEPYMLRWYVRPRNTKWNVYLHIFLHDDDDRALHDHPWWSWSLLLKGHLVEVYNDKNGVEKARDVPAGSLVYRGAEFAHRLIVPERGTTTLFITGPVVRGWGFHCPKGFRPWRQFVDPDNPGSPGRGCD